MKTTDIIRRAGRNLKRAKMRTFLTSVAIAVGGFAIMASLMAGEGARQYVDRVIGANIDPNGLFIVKDKKLVSADQSRGGSTGLQEYHENNVAIRGQKFQSLTAQDIEALRKRSDITNVQPVYQFQPKYITASTTGDKKYVADVQMRDDSVKVETVAGKSLEKGSRLAADEVVVPESYLETLGIKQPNDAIGKKITLVTEQIPQQVDEAKIRDTLLREGEAGVQALLEPKVLHKELTIAAVGKKTPDQISTQEQLLVDAAVAKELTDFTTKGTELYQKYFGATALAKQDPQTVKEAIEKEQGYTVSTAKDLQGLLFTFVNILQGIVMGFGALALIVSIFGIVNTQYISVLERTQQIGLMKALGASRRDIGRLFRYEAAWVGFLGGALGVLAAWGVGTALNPWISETLNFGEHSLLIFQPISAVGVVVLLMIVAIVAGFLPSRKAARLDPIEALRTE